MESGGAVSSGGRTQGWVAMGIAREHQSSIGSGGEPGLEATREGFTSSRLKEGTRGIFSHIWLLLIVQITAERNVTSQRGLTIPSESVLCYFHHSSVYLPSCTFLSCPSFVNLFLFLSAGSLKAGICLSWLPLNSLALT